MTSATVTVTKSAGEEDMESTEVAESLNDTTYDKENSSSEPSVIATMLLIIGFLGLMILMLKKIRSGPNVMQYTVTSNCYITYGTYGPNKRKYFIRGPPTGIGRNTKKDKLYLTGPYTHKSHSFISVSDLWKAKSQQSNNFFVINIIPEEPEEEEGKFNFQNQN